MDETTPKGWQRAVLASLLAVVFVLLMVLERGNDQIRCRQSSPAGNRRRVCIAPGYLPAYPAQYTI